MKLVRHKDAAGRLPEKENRKGTLRGIPGLALLLTLGVVLAAGGLGMRTSAACGIDPPGMEENGSPATGQDTGTQNAPSAGSLLTAAYRDSTVYVEASYGEEAKLPGDAELKASLVMPENDPDAYSQKIAAAMAAMGRDGETVPTNAVYHVGFYAGDQEIEPAAPVNVAVQILQDGFSAGEPIKVIHLGENDAEVIADTSVDDAGLISFTTDRFSDFVFFRGSDDTSSTSGTSNTSGMEGNSIVGTGRSIGGTIRQIAGSIMPKGGSGTSGSGKPMTIGNPLNDGEPTDGTGSDEPMATSEGAINLNDLNEGEVNLTFQYWDDESNTWKNIPKNIPEEGKSIFDYYTPEESEISIIFQFNKEFSEEELTGSKGMFTYTLPPYLAGFGNGESNVLYDQNGGVAGTVRVTGNEVTIKLNDDFLKANKTAKKLRFTLSGKVDLEKANEEDKGEGKYPGFDLEFPKDREEAHSRYGRLNLEKTCVSGAPQRDEATGEWYVDYELTVTALDYAMPAVSVEDVFSLSGNAKLEGLIDSYVKYSVEDDARNLDVNKTTPTADPPEKNSVYQTTKDDVPQLNWYLGDMTKDEHRTLYYRVKLNQEKMETTNFTKDGTNLFNNAKASSQDFVKDNADADLSIKTYVYVDKHAQNEEGKNASENEAFFEPDGEGGGWFTYKGSVQNQRNYPVEVKLYDSVNDPHTNSEISSNNGNGLSYDKESFEFDPDKDSAGRYFKDKIDFSENGDEYTSFTAHIGWLKPNERVTFTYRIHVDAEVLAAGEVKVHNSIISLFEGAKKTDDSYSDWLERFQQKHTVDRKQWVEKNYGGPANPEKIEIPEDDKVYDATKKPVTPNENPGSFTLGENSFKYTVTVNENTSWDVSSATMGDRLSGGLHYSGYVKVVAKDKAGNELGTAWVKVDGLKEFSFTGDDIEFKGERFGAGTSYELTYYTTIDTDNKNFYVDLGNNFTLQGEIVGPDGITRIPVSVQDRVTETTVTSNQLEVRKDAWYCESDEENQLGTFYWVVKVNASYIPSGFALKDVAGKGHELREDSLLGVYTGQEYDFSNDSEYPDWNAFKSLAEESSGFSKLPEGICSAQYKGEQGLTVTFKEDYAPARENPYVYLFFKTYITGRQTEPYENSVYSNEKSVPEEKVDYFEDKATNSLPGVGSVEKGGMQVFDWDGSIITWLDGNNNPNDYKIDVDILKGGSVPAGRYAAWSVSVNKIGNMQGDYTITDYIPEGMELSFVAIAKSMHIMQDGSRPTVPPWPIPLEDRSKGQSGLRVGHACKSENEERYQHGLDNWIMKGWKPWTEENWKYYPGEDGTVSWGVHIQDSVCKDNNGDPILSTGSAYEVDYLVVCRVTDDDVLLGVKKDGDEAAEKSFTNRVTVFEDGRKVGEAEANQTVPCKPVVKKDGKQVVTNGYSQQSIKFTLSVNEFATRVENVGETLKLTDRMSNNLSIKKDSVEFFSDKDCKKPLKEESPDLYNLCGCTYGEDFVTFTIPNGRAVYIQYECLINAPEGVETFAENTINFEDRQPPDSQDGTWNGTVSYNVTASIEGGKKLQITKIDSVEKGKMLSGAVFTATLLCTTNDDNIFEKYEGTDAVTTLKTKENGISDFFEPVEGGLYEIVETEAPKGYVTDDTCRYYWIGKGKLTPPTVEQVEEIIEKKLPDGAKIIPEYIGMIDLNISNERAKITVKKEFKNADGEAWGEENGTYTFGLFKKEGETYKKTEDAYGESEKTLTYPGDEDKELTFYVPYNESDPVDYYIFELDKPGGEPMESGSRAWIQTKMGPAQFGPSYEYEAGEEPADTASSNKNETTVTVTNTFYDAYSLPETGGPGTLVYLVAGLVLVLGSGLVLTARKRWRQAQ